MPIRIAPVDSKRTTFALRFIQSIGGKRFFLNSKVSVPSNLWLNGRQEVGVNEKALRESGWSIPMVNNANKRLAELRSKLEEIVNDEYQQPEFDVQRIKSRWEDFRDGKHVGPAKVYAKKGLSVTEAFSRFIKDGSSKRQAYTESGKAHKPSTSGNYEATRKVLNRYAEHIGKEIFLSKADLNFYNDFLKYCEAVEQSSVSTQGKYIRHLKKVLRWADENGHNPSPAFRHSTFREPRREPLILPVLNPSEIKQLASLPLFGRDEIARDRFLIGCYLGMRAADIADIENKTIVKQGEIEVLKFKPLKSKSRPVELFMRPEVVAMRQRWKGWPPAMTEQEINRRIKPICQAAGMTETMLGEVAKSVVVDGRRTQRKVRGKYPKWELIRMHSGRQSFATNCFDAGIPVDQIMQWTGHKKAQTFYLYINRQPGQSAQAMARYFAVNIE